MSLINEALKKAQRQRNLDATPAAPSGPAAAALNTHVPVASHRSSQVPIGLIAGMLLLGAGLAAAVLFFVVKPGQPQVAATTPLTPPTPAEVATPPPTPAPALPSITLPAMSAPVVTVATPAPPPASAPAPTIAPATSAPSPVASTTITPVSVPAPTGPVSQPTPSVTVTPAPAIVTPTQAPAPVVKPAAPPTPVAQATITREARVYAFLDSLRITGVRGSGLEARVLMNEKVYRINDLVDRDLGLRLSEVRSGLLVFTDSAGRQFPKPL